MAAKIFVRNSVSVSPSAYISLLLVYGFTPSLFKESYRIYILLVLNFGLRMVNSLRPGSTPLPPLSLALNLYDKMVSGIGQRPEWSKT